MIKRMLPLLFAAALALNAAAATVDNDDSCDISILPAATLLLPYFEVDLDQSGGTTTLFTITNVTNLDQIARVTLWTDRAYPVINFNVYLTGYDVQALNLFDIIARGIIAPDRGTGTLVTPKRGAFADRNPQLDLSECDRLPGTIDSAYVDRMQQAFTLGSFDDLARVTLWTDYSVPVISFNVYLTGYDVQSINLFDVIATGRIAPNLGTGTLITPRGKYSDRNEQLDLGDCRRLAVQLEEGYIERMQDAFLYGQTGDLNGVEGCDEIGNVHDNAVGYATIDLVRNCSTNGPQSAEYWREDLAYDNVLIGDYQQVSSSQNFAQSGTMVHVRAVPEGGTQDERLANAQQYHPRGERTFYSRYQSPATPKLDARQPLPSTFAARWIQGGAGGFQTSFKTWREGKGGHASCGHHDESGVTKVMEVVRFDEAENGIGDIPVSRVCTPIFTENTLPTTSRTSVADASIYPQLTNGAIGGWMYVNLDNCERDQWGSQNWVTVSMRAEGRYSVDFDAAALGNGCSPAAAESEVTRGTRIIGPAANSNSR